MAKRQSHTNRLIHEKSPYLLQHAHNPVDWYPWGEEAFATAQKLDKPIFLSIGYATCHWCHNMAKESFENVEIASLLNETFVNVKVDREELPEVDSLYMEFAQSMISGAAGWPLNVVLTPALKPFFAATYLPPRTAEGLVGIQELVSRIREVWDGEDRAHVVAQAEKIVEVFANNVHTTGEELPPKEYIDVAVELYYKITDPVYGGIRGAPKFPVGYQLDVLLQYSHLFDDSRAMFLLDLTLDMMQRGGIYDHLGGGFSRYSIDVQWRVPHFEKMLYDNALLAHAYLDAWKVTRRDLYRMISSEILEYTLSEMTRNEGGFYSAQDADSAGQEGLYYTWTPEEICQAVGPKNTKLAEAYYGVTKEGDLGGRSVLHTPQRPEAFAAEQGMTLEGCTETLAFIKQKLRAARDQRIPPATDDKILTSWNGLMIHAMVEAGSALGNPQFIDSAIQAARMIKDHLWSDGKLLHRWRDGDSSFIGSLDDYAFLIRALITMFEANAGVSWLKWALEMTDLLKDKFKAEGGAFYQTDGEESYLVLRKCQYADGAEPSGNAIHCENLLRLYSLTLDRQYLEQAEDILRAVKYFLDSFSPGYAYHLLNVMRYYHHKVPTVVVALNKFADHRAELHAAMFGTYHPHRAIIWRNESDPDLFTLLPHTSDQAPLQGETTLYICYNGVCERPLTDKGEMLEALGKMI